MTRNNFNAAFRKTHSTLHFKLKYCQKSNLQVAFLRTKSFTVNITTGTFQIKVSVKLFAFVFMPAFYFNDKMRALLSVQSIWIKRIEACHLVQYCVSSTGLASRKTAHVALTHA